MKVRRRSGPGPTRRREATDDPEVDHALDAMSAPELRAAIRVVLDQLDDGVKDSIIDALLARGAKARSGWRPTRPSPRIVEEAKSFAEAARQIGQADPDDVTEHLRRATKAFLAGEHASARAVFDALLPPIACADIDLGQHELVEEVLGVDVRACVAQYAASVYTTTALRERADAIVRVLEQVEGVGTLSSWRARSRVLAQCCRRDPGALQQTGHLNDAHRAPSVCMGFWALLRECAQDRRSGLPISLRNFADTTV